MAGGIIKYVPLQPPKHGASQTSSASEWKIDMKVLEETFSPKTRMLVSQWLLLKVRSAD